MYHVSSLDGSCIFSTGWKAYSIFKKTMQAEAWLRDRAQKEGWAKASKLQSRPMSQGLIGIATQDKAAAIVEVGFCNFNSVKI